MNASAALSQLNTINSKCEGIFTQLSSVFPQLTVPNSHTTFQELKNALSSISGSLTAKSSSNMANFSEKYTPIFDKLNEKIKDLQSLDKLIAEVKEDSEQMELIALNAMVISVKSGEKGLAFSKITENLQRLSKDMFISSDKLSAEEAQLLEQINSLKSIFSGIIESQRSISSKDTECSSELQRMLSNVQPSISEISGKVDSIYPAIERALSVTEFRPKLSSAFQSVTHGFNEMNKYNPAAPGSGEELDYVCFSIAACEKNIALLSNLSSLLSQACAQFAGAWQEVVEIMENADTKRMDFESRFLNNHAFGNDNIAKQLSLIIEKYRLMIGQFNNYHMVQKDLQGTCHNITSRAKGIYSVFETLRPVMSRLHHVRILQQIEVSKNDAIKSVQDSVTDMDNLINSANTSLDGIQAILESFMQDTGNMLDNFSSSIAVDNENMVSLCNEKEVVYGDLNNSESIIARAFHDFTVFPDDFQKKCVTAQQGLQDFMRLNTEISIVSNELETEKNALASRKTSLLNEKSLQNWTITNPKYLDSLSQIK
mgnify:FL=1